MKTQNILRQKLVLGGLIAILVISSFMYMPTIADNHDDEDDDGVGDEVEEENEREVEVEYSSNEVEIKSSIENNGIENEFEVKVKTGDEGLEFKLEFEEDNDTLETEIEFEVKITEIVEFVDSNANGIYDGSDDDKIQVLKLDNFKNIDYKVETIDNETVHVLFVETVDEVFSATLYATGEFADINGVVVAPTQVKVDIGIHNFNYTEDDSQLALKVKLESEREVDYEDDEETEDEEIGYADDEHGVAVLLDEYSGFFSWIETAMVDGVEQEVKVTPLEMNSEENKMYLNYPRGTEIIHDPKVGLSNLLQIENNTSFVGSNDLLIISAAAVLALTSLVLVFRKRFKK